MENMEYQEFKEIFIKRMWEKIDFGANLEIVVIRLNNQKMSEELKYVKAECEINPTIRLDDMYEKYKMMEMEWCVESALESLNKERVVDNKNIFCAWETAKEKIVSELINREWNQDISNTIPHKEFLDLVVVFSFSENEIKGSAILLRTDLLNCFAKMQESDLFILPFTVQRVLLVPYRGNVTAEELRKEVRETKQNEIRIEDRLSDEVYYFEKGRESLEVANS